MATNSNNDSDHFDENEWQAGAKDAPKFEFEEVTGEPNFDAGDFAEDDGAAKNEDEFERMWRDARPPEDERSFQGHAANPDMPSEDERLWAMIGHAAGAVSLFLTGGTAGWLVPLVIWIVRDNKEGFAADQAREALNFHLTAFLISLLAIPLLCLGVGFLILFAIPICTFIYSIIGAMRTWNGERYDYPINFRLI